MRSFIELILYFFVRSFGVFIRFLPVGAALGLGRAIGVIAYYCNFKHRQLTYTNLKIAFAKTKFPHELKQISKQVFQNYGQNVIELFRLPLMNAALFEKYITMEGKEHVQKSLQQGQGVILLAMHFGSWELASVTSSLFGHSYKVLVKPQKKFTKLGELLNNYRTCGGSVVVERGFGTREIIKSLRNNEIIGMVVDQGGRDGTLVPFFDRQASMSVGAIRMGLKMGIPICFAIIIRENGPHHRLVIHPPFSLVNTENQEEDIEKNLLEITRLMEKYIRQYPAEYMWFYKIWKYSKESVLLILSDGKTGHLRQSQTVAAMITKALIERDVSCSTQVFEVQFKNKWSSQLMSLLSIFTNAYLFQGRMGFLRWFLTEESFAQVTSLKADFIISCGSRLAGINNLLADEQQAKSIVVLKPGLLPFDRFDLIVLPQHDQPAKKRLKENVVMTKGAPNLITSEYLESQARLLTNRYSHLKLRGKLKIGVLVGGDTKDYFLSESNVKLVINQIKEVAEEINADILLTTSRRTSEKVENMLQREMKKHPACQLLILANRSNVPEALGGILGLSDIIVVSGDSVSMISEAASSGKDTIVFPVQSHATHITLDHKHHIFIDKLNAQGYIVSTNAKDIRRAIYDVAKNKIKTKKLDDNEVIFEAVKQII